MSLFHDDKTEKFMDSLNKPTWKIGCLDCEKWKSRVEAAERRVEVLEKERDALKAEVEQLQELVRDSIGHACPHSLRKLDCDYCQAMMELEGLKKTSADGIGGYWYCKKCEEWIQEHKGECPANDGRLAADLSHDRDRWKQMAERMAEALETIIANPVSACSERHDIVAQEALASYAALVRAGK